MLIVRPIKEGLSKQVDEMKLSLGRRDKIGVTVHDVIL